mmetsp:Transcript_26904/g.70691  ORF Transcript_26904/g.70691 Transcript_26904/m.70691 type:complete len:222 (+) Transcript_26904:207-872(+)
MTSRPPPRMKSTRFRPAVNSSSKVMYTKGSSFSMGSGRHSATRSAFLDLSVRTAFILVAVFILRNVVSFGEVTGCRLVFASTSCNSRAREMVWGVMSVLTISTTKTSASIRNNRTKSARSCSIWIELSSDSATQKIRSLQRDHALSWRRRNAISINMPPSCMIHHTSIDWVAGSAADGVADSYFGTMNARLAARETDMASSKMEADGWVRHRCGHPRMTVL